MDDLTGARVVTTIIVNGVPQTAIELVEGVRKFRCALGLRHYDATQHGVPPQVCGCQLALDCLDCNLMAFAAAQHGLYG